MVIVAGEMGMQSLMERLRPLTGLKGWDYCVLWKLSEDQRFLDWMDCCCAGGAQTSSQPGGEELLFPVSSTVVPCRDAMLQHPRTKSCVLLAQLPSSICLDCGIHGQTLISNQPRWFNFCNTSDSSVLEETVGTGLLVPVFGGLIELFVAKQVAEDEHVINFVITQSKLISMEHEAMMSSSNIDSIFSVNVCGSNADHDDQKDPNLNDLPSHCHRSAMNFLQQDVFFEESHDSFHSEKGMMNMNAFKSLSDCEFQEMEAATQKEQLEDDRKDSKTKQMAANQLDLVSDCSDQIDDEDELKYQRKTGRGAQSKNIDAERKRRKKLNDRLYTLRSLVPKITKLDRASILGDAIEFVKELQKQVKDLQDDLEENSDADENGKRISDSKNIGPENLNEQEEAQNRETDRISDNSKTQQMEPQVEVAQIEGNEFFVKVFCEHKAGGFVKLMEALSCLGLEVSNANVTSCKGLVSNVFKVEKRDSDLIQANHVRDSLLELTKNPPDRMVYASGNGGGGGFDINFNHLRSHLFGSHHLHQN